ncbi:ABC transporter permease [Pontimonas sp.]|nr:ABC transporter permease [Pontimonas sp.]
MLPILGWRESDQNLSGTSKLMNNFQNRVVRALSVGKILGTDDVKETYRRTFVGPLWITIGLGVQVAMIGVVFSLIFSADLKTYLPYLAVSLVVWNFLQQTISDGCNTFISSERLIKQIPLPFMAYALRTLWKQTFVFAHNFLVIPVVFLIFGYGLTTSALFLPLGFLIVLVNLGWVVTVVGIISARYRDLGPIVQSFLTMAFYVSPVIWLPTAIPVEYRGVILGLNPFFHLMEMVRSPLLGEVPDTVSIVVSMGLAVVGSVFAWLLLRNFSSRIAFWV